MNRELAVLRTFVESLETSSPAIREHLTITGIYIRYDRVGTARKELETALAQAPDEAALHRALQAVDAYLEKHPSAWTRLTRWFRR